MHTELEGIVKTTPPAFHQKVSFSCWFQTSTKILAVTLTGTDCGGHPADLRGPVNHPLAHAVTVVELGTALFPGYLFYTAGLPVPRTQASVGLLAAYTGMPGGPGHPTLMCANSSMRWCFMAPKGRRACMVNMDLVG